MTHDLFQTHSDVQRAWPDLFVGLPPAVTRSVVNTAANSLLEGIQVDREEVQRMILHAQHLHSNPPAQPRRVTA